jgi:hypothetical protein
VPDCIQAVLEFTGGVNLMYDATLGSSFDNEYETLCGTCATLVSRNGGLWMFKELDAPILGWEVYSKKSESFGQIFHNLIFANPSDPPRSLPIPNLDRPDPKVMFAAFSSALKTFAVNAGMMAAQVADYISTYGESDLIPLETRLATRLSKVPGWKEGLEATVVAIKANEAIMKKERIVLTDDMFNV